MGDPEAAGGQPQVITNLIGSLCNGLAMHVAEASREALLKSPRTYHGLSDIQEVPRSVDDKQRC